MKFEHWVILLAGLLYASVGVSYLIKSQYAWCLVWFAYALANLAYIVALRGV